MKKMLSILLTLAISFNFSVPALAGTADIISKIPESEEIVENNKREEPVESFEVTEPEIENIAYAMLYEDGTLIFQYGNKQDDGHGKCIDVFTDFETETYIGANESISFVRTSAPWGKYYKLIESIEIRDLIKPLRLSNWFRGLRNLKTITGLSNIDVSNVTDMSYMFEGCGQLISVDALGWNTSKVTNFSRMFYDCRSLEDVEHISDWDTGKAESFSYMFGNCESLQNLNISTWDVRNVRNAMGMFSNCSELRSLGNLNNWDTRMLSNIGAMFDSCKSLENLYINNWDTSNIIYTNSTFRNCESLKLLDLSMWDTTKVEHSENMFQNCVNIEKLDLLSFGDNFRDPSMFSNLINLKQLSVGPKFQIELFEGTFSNEDIEIFSEKIISYDFEEEIKINESQVETVESEEEATEPEIDEPEYEVIEIVVEETEEKEERDNDEFDEYTKIDVPIIPMPILFGDTTKSESIAPVFETTEYMYNKVSDRFLWRYRATV